MGPSASDSVQPQRGWVPQTGGERYVPATSFEMPTVRCAEVARASMSMETATSSFRDNTLDPCEYLLREAIRKHLPVKGSDRSAVAAV